MAQPFPVPLRSATATISNENTTATSHFFADKILITLTQTDRLAQWISVPLSGGSDGVGGLANGFQEHDQQASRTTDEDTLPLSHLTPTTLLGAGDSERETRGQLLGAAIGSLILERKAEERRTLVLGLGLKGRGFDGDNQGREEFRNLIELVGKVI